MKRNSGFTLIELLIVIAVLSVILISVIFFMNPLENFAKSRDAGRISEVNELGSAITRFMTKGNSSYPMSTPNWQSTILKANAEIAAPIQSTGSKSCNAGNNEGNICYISTGVDAIIWTNAESKAAAIIAQCQPNQVPVIAWIASQGRTGYTCLANTTAVPSSDAANNMFDTIVLSTPSIVIVSNQPTPTPTSTPSGGSIIIISSSTTPSPTPVNRNYYPANIDFPASGAYGQYSQAALNNLGINGIDINMNWVDVEPQQGVYNFGPIDQEITTWVQAGKEFTLVVRYIADTGTCTGTQYMPQWEIQRIPHFCDTLKGTIIPNYFDQTFITDLETFVKAIGSHFTQSPYKANLAYIRVGLGVAGEGFPIFSLTSNPDWSQLIAYGYTPASWRDWQRARMATFKAAFPWTKVIYPINVQGTTDPANGLPLQVSQAYWAAANGLGIGSQTLSPGFTYAQINTIAAYINKNYPGTYIQFQTKTGVNSSSTVQGDIQTAQNYGARSIEWYENVVGNNSYTPLFQQWQQYVNTTYGTMP